MSSAAGFREAFRAAGGRSVSLNLWVVRVFLWRDGHRRWGLTIDASDLRNGW
jgi:hypothetical protein